MKKYGLYFIVIFSFFLFTSNVFAYSFEGHYECYNGGTLLNRTNFSLDWDGDITWRCNSGYTNVNFYFQVVGYPSSNMNTDTLSAVDFQPSSPLGISYGFNASNTSSRCLVSSSKIICPVSYTNQFSFALFGDGGYYWHVFKNFDFSTSEERSALANYQSQWEMQQGTNSAINNSTNSINSNSNANKNEIINNQNSQFNEIKQQNEELKQQQEEQNETSKGIWGTIKEIFSSIVGLPVKIFNGIKGIFLPESECVQVKDLIVGLEKGSIDVNGIETSSSFAYRTGFIEIDSSNYYSIQRKIIFEDTSKSTMFRTYDANKNFLGSVGGMNYKTLNYKAKFNSNVKYVRIVQFLEKSSTTIEELGLHFELGEVAHKEEEFGTEVCTGGSFGDWFDNVVSGIGKFFSNLTNSIGNFFHDLLTGILDGLKALFVPTDEQLYEIINDSKDLAENFGFVGESINFFINIFTSLLGMVNANGCVELPEFSIGPTSLFEKFTFWNAQYVCLADNVILSTHIDTIRTVTSIVLVCLFIGFAAAKFFNILSKNDNNQASMDAYDLRDRR